MWLPIETAPCNTEVLVYENGNDCAVAWQDDMGVWITPLPKRALTMTPTHWQPLPAPPKEA